MKPRISVNKVWAVAIACKMYHHLVHDLLTYTANSFIAISNQRKFTVAYY